MHSSPLPFDCRVCGRSPVKRDVCNAAGKPKSVFANAHPAAAPKQSLAQDVARRTEALSAGHKKCVQIFQKAQAEAQEVLAAVSFLPHSVAAHFTDYDCTSC